MSDFEIEHVWNWIHRYGHEEAGLPNLSIAEAELVVSQNTIEGVVNEYIRLGKVHELYLAVYAVLETGVDFGHGLIDALFALGGILEEPLSDEGNVSEMAPHMPAIVHALEQVAPYAKKWDREE